MAYPPPEIKFTVRTTCLQLGNNVIKITRFETVNLQIKKSNNITKQIKKSKNIAKKSQILKFADNKTATTTERQIIPWFLNYCTLPRCRQHNFAPNAVTVEDSAWP